MNEFESAGSSSKPNAACVVEREINKVDTYSGPYSPPFFTYINEFKDTFLLNFPDIRRLLPRVLDEGARKWKAMSDSEKASYVEKSATMRAEYHIAIQRDYVNTNCVGVLGGDEYKNKWRKTTTKRRDASDQVDEVKFIVTPPFEMFINEFKDRYLPIVSRSQMPPRLYKEVLMEAARTWETMSDSDKAPYMEKVAYITKNRAAILSNNDVVKKHRMDSGPPKHPQCPFVVFLEAWMDPGVIDEGRRKWEAMSDSDKTPYVEKFATLRAEYEIAIKQYNKESSTMKSASETPTRGDGE